MMPLGAVKYQHQLPRDGLRNFDRLALPLPCPSQVRPNPSLLPILHYCSPLPAPNPPKCHPHSTTQGLCLTRLPPNSKRRHASASYRDLLDADHGTVCGEGKASSRIDCSPPPPPKKKNSKPRHASAVVVTYWMPTTQFVEKEPAASPSSRIDCSREAIIIGLNTLSSKWPLLPATDTPTWLPMTCTARTAHKAHGAAAHITFSKTIMQEHCP